MAISQITNKSITDATITADDIASGAVEGAMTTQIGGRRNLIINGSAIVDQRNSGAARTTDGYVADRWFLQAVSEDQLVFSADQDTTTPDNFAKSLRVQVTTAETSVDANDLFRWIHKIEAQNLQMLNYGSSAAQSFTLSFYVRSSLTGTYALNFHTTGS